MKGLDRYLTTPPDFDDGALEFCEKLTEGFSEGFYEENMIWIDESNISQSWHENLMKRWTWTDGHDEEELKILDDLKVRHMSVKEGLKLSAKIYEKAFNIYIKPKLK